MPAVAGSLTCDYCFSLCATYSYTLTSRILLDKTRAFRYEIMPKTTPVWPPYILGYIDYIVLYYLSAAPRDS